MDLNKHNPDPHNVQYLLSILRGDGDAGEAPTTTTPPPPSSLPFNTNYGFAYDYNSTASGSRLPSQPDGQVQPAPTSQECTPRPTKSADSPLQPLREPSAPSNGPPSPSRSQSRSPEASKDPRKRPAPAASPEATAKRLRPDSQNADEDVGRASPGTTSSQRRPAHTNTPSRTATSTTRVTDSAAPAPNRPPSAPPSRTLLSMPAVLPTLRTLSKSPKFLRLLMTLKRQQDTLERSLKYEHDEMIAAKATSSAIAKFKFEALERWDEQMEIQQVQLAQAGLPNFWKTKSKVVREAQREVLEVLGGMVGK